MGSQGRSPDKVPLARDRATAPPLPCMPVAVAFLCLLQGRVGSVRT